MTSAKKIKKASDTKILLQTMMKKNVQFAVQVKTQNGSSIVTDEVISTQYYIVLQLTKLVWSFVLEWRR